MMEKRIRISKRGVHIFMPENLVKHYITIYINFVSIERSDGIVIKTYILYLAKRKKKRKTTVTT